MNVTGDEASQVMFPRARPFPLPPHRFTGADRVMMAAMPEMHFGSPSARASRPAPGRGVCCNSATCHLCPANAKFTAENGLATTYADARVTLKTNAEVVALDAQNGAVTRVHYRDFEKDAVATSDLFVPGANAIFSPAILQRSGLATPLTGRGLHEQFGAEVEVPLDGLDHFDGGTVNTAMNYALLDGPHRRDAKRSDYAQRGIDRAMGLLPSLLSPLPVERIELRGYRESEAHMQGTLRMGLESATSVVDAGQVHHQYRNLVVVGTSVFPSCSVANPSLTAAALSIRAASRLL